MGEALRVHEPGKVLRSLLAHASDAQGVQAQPAGHHRHIHALAAHVHPHGADAVYFPQGQGVDLHGFIKGRVQANAGDHRKRTLLSACDYTMAGEPSQGRRRTARRGDWKLMLFSCLPLAFCESCAMIEHVEARKGACRPCCAGFLRGIITRCFCKTGRNSACV